MSWSDPTTVQLWLLAMLVVLAAATPFLLLALYSVRAQRSTRVPMEAMGDLDSLKGSIEGLTGGWFTEGNEVEILENGDGFFPRLLEDIEGAGHHVHLETYVWWRGAICDRLAALLAEKAGEGVEVRLVLDFIGALKMEKRLERKMRVAGVTIERYNALTLRTFARINKRTHRKLAIVDGRIGYVFSHGFAAEWEGAGDGEDSWRDLGARLRGPIVGRVQSAFAQHWMEESSEVLAGEDYFPALETHGDVPCQLVTSSPRGGVSSVAILLRLMVATAKEELLIINPYCAPADALTSHMVSAAERGVRVRLMVPGPVTDSQISQYAGRHQYERLLTAGVEILRHGVTLPHQKLVIVDRLWSHVGSANFDERSFDINAENCLTMVDERVAGVLVESFERDVAQCEPVELESWRQRPLRYRVLEKMAFAVHQQL